MTKKKTLKTIKETKTGRNIKTIDLKNLTEKQNKELIKKQKAGKLPGYKVVKRTGQKEFLQSIPDKKKKNNLDPKINKKGKK
jgi:hypothetical protein